MTRFLIAVLLGMTLAGCAEWREARREVKETGKAAGHATRDVTRAAGYEVRRVGREIGHGARDAAKSLGKATADAARDVREKIEKDD